MQSAALDRVRASPRLPSMHGNKTGSRKLLDSGGGARATAAAAIVVRSPLQRSGWQRPLGAPTMRHRGSVPAVLGSIERAHPAVRLVPDANVDEPRVKRAGGCQQFEKVAPIHKNIERCTGCCPHQRAIGVAAH